jgi:hypothetical protein
MVALTAQCRPSSQAQRMTAPSPKQTLRQRVSSSLALAKVRQPMQRKRD